jgi:hypothetical protein
MNPAETKQLASAWINAWNTGELDKIMEYYADDVELYSPFVIDRWDIPEGKLRGKQKLQEHFAKAFEISPVRNLNLLEILFGVNSFIIVYRNKEGNASADLVELNEKGKVKTVRSYYGKK